MCSLIEETDSLAEEPALLWRERSNDPGNVRLNFDIALTKQTDKVSLVFSGIDAECCTGDTRASFYTRLLGM